MSRLRAIAAAVLLGLAGGAVGSNVFEERPFEDPGQRERYKTLIYELRCLVCQNQNLADSNAELASDLRREIYRMIVDGKSDEQIIDFMVARYGDFVLYRPPLKPKTVLLWSGPFILGIAGIGLLIVHLKRRRAAEAPAPLTAEERKRLDALLENDHPR